jgi:hypothetical protein
MLPEFISSFSLSTIMKGLPLTSVVFVISIFYLDAFLVSPRSKHAIFQKGNTRFQFHESLNNNDDKESLGHGDILWKVRPPPGVSVWKRLWLRLAANVLRLDCKIKRQEPPVVLCPKGRQVVLEAHYRPNDSSKYEKIGRFGITTERGPSNPPIQETVNELYSIDPRISVAVAAIIYMVVEEPYRKRNVGGLALEVISLIHAIQGSDFTVLVVDDNGSGKLIDWYAKYGYSKAPKLQEVLGSPNAIHGITMIAPTRQIVPDNCFIQWW